MPSPAKMVAKMPILGLQGSAHPSSKNRSPIHPSGACTARPLNSGGKTAKPPPLLASGRTEKGYKAAPASARHTTAHTSVKRAPQTTRQAEPKSARAQSPIQQTRQAPASARARSPARHGQASKSPVRSPTRQTAKGTRTVHPAISVQAESFAQAARHTSHDNSDSMEEAQWLRRYCALNWAETSSLLFILVATAWVLVLIVQSSQHSFWTEIPRAFVDRILQVTHGNPLLGLALGMGGAFLLGQVCVLASQLLDILRSHCDDWKYQKLSGDVEAGVGSTAANLNEADDDMAASPMGSTPRSPPPKSPPKSALKSPKAKLAHAPACSRVLAHEEMEATRTEEEEEAAVERAVAKESAAAMVRRRKIADMLKAGQVEVAAMRLFAPELDASAFKEAGYSAYELTKANFSPAELREAGYTAVEARRAGLPLAQLKDAGYSPAQLYETNVSLEDLRMLGFTCAEMRSDGLSALQLAELGYSARELRDVYVSASELCAVGFGLADLRAAMYPASELRLAGFGVDDLLRCRPRLVEKLTAPDLIAAGYSAAELMSSRGGFELARLVKMGLRVKPKDVQTGLFTAKELRDDALWTAKQVAAEHFDSKELRVAGFSASELRAAGLTLKELHALGCTPAEIREAGWTATELKALQNEAPALAALRAAGYTVQELKIAGYKLDELLVAGFSARALRDGGFTAAQLKTAGMYASQLKTAGFGIEELVQAGFSMDVLRAAGCDVLTPSTVVDVAGVAVDVDPGAAEGVAVPVAFMQPSKIEAGREAGEVDLLPPLKPDGVA
jgi:ribosomal protein L13E